MQNEMIQKSGVDTGKIQKYLEAMGLAANLTKNETEQFIEIAQGFGLNPFKREIYAGKYGDKFSVIVGFETYIKRAERSGKLSGWQVTTAGNVNFEKPKQSTLVATITIHRTDFKFPFVHEVYFSEYYGTRRDGSLTDFWRNKPTTMIKKVAMAQGFRLCFSDELGGMPYTAEELQHETSSIPISPSEIIETKVSQPEIKIIQDPAIKLPGLFAAIDSATSKPELIALWTQNPDLHGIADFKNKLKAKRDQLDAPPALTSEQKIELIKQMDDVAAINELLKNESDVDVLDYAMQKIDGIQANRESNILDF